MGQNYSLNLLLLRLIKIQANLLQIIIIIENVEETKLYKQHFNGITDLWLILLCFCQYLRRYFINFPVQKSVANVREHGIIIEVTCHWQSFLFEFNLVK